MRRHVFTVLAVLISYLCASVHAEECVHVDVKPEGKVSMHGNVYDLAGDPNKAIFYFKRTEKVKDGKRIVEGFFFNSEDSKLALYEKIVYPEGSSIFEEYLFDRAFVNDQAKMTIKDGKLHYHYIERGEVTDNKETHEDNTINRDEVVSFINKNWETLNKGERIKSRFIIPDRAETIGFGMKKAEDTTVNGISVTKIIMFATSPFIAMVAGDTFLYFEKDGQHRLIRVDGRTPLMKKEGDKYKSLSGRMDFYYDDPDKNLQPELAKTEPTKSEPVKPEPVKSETTTPEITKAQTDKKADKKTDNKKTENKKSEGKKAG